MGKRQKKRKNIHEDINTEEEGDSFERLKQEKEKIIAAFTKARQCLLLLLDEEDLPSRTEVRRAREKLNDQLDKVMDDLSKILMYYEGRKEKGILTKVRKEIEQIEANFTAAQDRA